MDLRQLRTFVHVAELKSFTKAASLLNISQPALSRQMRLLEEELGTKLLHRTGRGIWVTNDGLALLERCTALLNEFESIRVDFSSSAKMAMVSGTVGVGIPVPASRILTDLVANDRASRMPGVSLRVVEGFSALIHEWLISGSIDLAILYGPKVHRVLDREVVLVEKLFAIMQATDENRARKAISLAELSSRPLIVPHEPHVIRDLLDMRAGRTPQLMQVDSITLMVGLARAGRGSALLPRGGVAEAIDAGYVVAVPIEEDLSWDVSICYSNLRPLTEAAQLTMRIIREEMVRLVKHGHWPDAVLR
ncbi:LysR family transcriptional regulator [Xanthobacter dioxanivorans]|uniref:LysR family transcriptional regulator n=1 Tax=Xanthobacter dioxanivorans TaxID=2528964 RepID=A0A974PJH3_9HYPH|nr:LysR family transcriptional regulator [Xanthobacter dioxanivorans]QRG04649.1 LysR family transcriptional regulator [Xanthobacter dioxanivorans]